MRLLVSGLMAASLLTSPLMAAECTRPAEHTALDVTALKTQLMVMALTCKADDRYNSFVTKYRTDLLQNDKEMNGFFARSYGRSAAKQRDDYVTQLANSESQTGLKQGSLYCDNNMAIFDEVMSLRNSGELIDFAAGKMITAQPIEVSDCGPGAERPARVVRTVARKRS